MELFKAWFKSCHHEARTTIYVQIWIEINIARRKWIVMWMWFRMYYTQHCPSRSRSTHCNMFYAEKGVRGAKVAMCTRRLNIRFIRMLQGVKCAISVIKLTHSEKKVWLVLIFNPRTIESNVAVYMWALVYHWQLSNWRTSTRWTVRLVLFDPGTIIRLIIYQHPSTPDVNVNVLCYTQLALSKSWTVLKLSERRALEKNC